MKHRHYTDPTLASIRPRLNAETCRTFACRVDQLGKAAVLPLPSDELQQSSVLDQFPADRFALIWGHDVVFSNRGSRCWYSNDNPDATFRTPLTRVSGRPQRLTRTRHIPPQRWRLNALTAGGTPRNLVVEGEPQGSPVEKGCVQNPSRSRGTCYSTLHGFFVCTPLAAFSQARVVKDNTYTPLSLWREGCMYCCYE